MASNLADDISKCIFLNENDSIPIQIWLKFVPRTPIDNMPVFTWTNDDPVYWRIYASLGGDELKAYDHQTTTKVWYK